MERSEPGYCADNRGEKICGVVECHNESSLRYDIMERPQLGLFPRQ